MSFDLFLNSERSPLTENQFKEYFSERDHYTIDGSQAFYENRDTGVYFYFEYDADDPNSIAFNLNYFRPHFFGIEAAPEVADLILEFDLSIDDPQAEGMGDGPFSIEGFLRSWNAGNRFGYKAVLSSEPRPETHVYPTQELQRIWNWNFNRYHLQDKAGEDHFVPLIMFTKGHNQARTYIVWPHTCPIYMPKADDVVVIRKKPGVDPDSNNSDEFTIVNWNDIESAVAEYPFDEKGEFYRLDYGSPPRSLMNFVESVPLVPPDREMGLANDSVLNAELVSEFE
ncbi:hypothetical protein Pan258_01490 [Symmachiella dynata]|uniref:hypothetical protein n=1 Tax=Symmachiella dynata TaxID=2527995 RepID=UPI00118D3BAD|nr:hypothetical protein [Symmachiella dynata]QDT46132.1 hypothetical protein Pan258_01490 [Symmachiella dynata]